jgi:hypothetical protein
MNLEKCLDISLRNLIKFHSLDPSEGIRKTAEIPVRTVGVPEPNTARIQALISAQPTCIIVFVTTVSHNLRFGVMKIVNGLKNTKVPSSSGFLNTVFRYHWSKRQNKTVIVVVYTLQGDKTRSVFKIFCRKLYM